MHGLIKTLESSASCRIMVVGDLMLDRFVYGDVERISPESPVPVVKVSEEKSMLGGAGNVSANLAALGFTPVIVALIGDDAQGREVIDIARSHKADIHIVSDDTRPTTIKTRFLARHQHMLRTDVEKTHPASPAVEKSLIAAVEKGMKDVRAVVLSDYGKGVLTNAVIAATIAAARKQGVPVLVDPKGLDYTIYRGADYVTPNRKELSEATGGAPLKTDEEIVAAAASLSAKAGIGCVVATRSEDGMSVIRDGKALTHLRAQVREVFDVSGAGDTVIAVLAAMLAGGAGIEDAARMANFAAGIAVSKVGTTPVYLDELRGLLSANSLSGRQARLAATSDARAQIAAWQAQGLKVGFTNGCFDIIHKGHVNYLEQARSHCDRLVLALNSDASVRILKGPTRPINDEDARAAVIGSLSSVDLVVLFGAQKAGEDNTPCALIDSLRPDIFFKGGDYTIDQLPEAKIVHGYGGEVAIMGLEDGFSTTNIIAKSADKATKAG